ncbi:MAG: macro domain-containing protein [Gemmatimonadota bacterium]|nr:macro domain-containing protein [Gemmatimonadota bacterium]
MIRVVVDDIAFVLQDAIVRPVNETLETASQALRHIERVGGAKLLDQIPPDTELEVGAATVTGGGDLNSEFVIHAVIKHANDPITVSGVKRGIQSALEQAVRWQFGSLGIPPMGTGPGDLGFEQSADLLCDLLHRHLRKHDYPSTVTIVVATEAEKSVFENFLKLKAR